MMHPQGPQGETERRTAGKAPSGRPPNVPEARFDQRSGMRTASASVHTLHAFGRRGDQPESHPPSLIRRIFRTVIRFAVTLLIGIGGTLAWQSYGDGVKGMVAVEAPAAARVADIVTDVGNAGVQSRDIAPQYRTTRRQTGSDGPELCYIAGGRDGH